MKKILLAFTLVITFAACKKDPVKEPVTEKPEVENITFFVSRIKTESSPAITPVANSFYHLLGYGFDVNGRYADSSAARNQVIDIQKLKSIYPGKVNHGLMFQSGSPDIIVAENAETFSELLSKRLDETKALKAFKTSITSLTDSGALSKKYMYARAMYSIYNKKAWFYLNPADSLKNILSSAFMADAVNLSPAGLVKKYGTHVMNSIQLGLKLEIIYQAETGKEDREGKALIGLSRATKKIFGLESGYYFSGPAYINSNSNQKVYFKTFGGDPATLPQLPADNTINPQIDFRNWIFSNTVENSSLLDIASDGLTPLDDFVLDPVKKASLKTYIEQYIQQNSVRLID